MLNVQGEKAAPYPSFVPLALHLLGALTSQSEPSLLQADKTRPHLPAYAASIILTLKVASDCYPNPTRHPPPQPQHALQGCNLDPWDVDTHVQAQPCVHLILSAVTSSWLQRCLQTMSIVQDLASLSVLSPLLLCIQPTSATWVPDAAKHRVFVFTFSFPMLVIRFGTSLREVSQSKDTHTYMYIHIWFICMYVIYVNHIQTKAVFVDMVHTYSENMYIYTNTNLHKYKYEPKAVFHQCDNQSL